MKRVIRFSAAYIPSAIFSLILIVFGIVGYIVNGGFNLGVDFQAGLMQELQFAPSAFSLTYAGKGVASVSLEQDRLDLVISGSDVEKATHSFVFSEYATLGALAEALNGLEGFKATSPSNAEALSPWLIQSAQENPRLGSDPYVLHYLAPESSPIPIEDVRAALIPVGSASVQVLGKESDRKFMIRVQDEGNTDGFAQVATEQINAALAVAFGEDQVAVARSDYVGARFSKNLTDQVAVLLVLTLLLILVYSAIRFRPRYAVGAVIAIIHDALIMVAFVVWSRMEFTTSTIAAILTILGYSINDTIVIFDRVRETVRLYPDDDFTLNVNRANTETLARTIITTMTTMFAVLSLYLFTTGSMKDFALALLIGLVSGVYSSLFIANNFVVMWSKIAGKRSTKAKKRAGTTMSTAKA